MTHDELLDEITAYERRTCNSAQDEKTLREQIAREIETELRCLCEKLHEIELQSFPESTSFPMCHRCIAAAIARGNK
jgi:predicted component of type VI protein secretion system